MKLYREVLCSERLPKTAEYYFCITKYDKGYWNSGDWVYSDGNKFKNSPSGYVVFWLEPIEITEEEIEELRMSILERDSWVNVATMDITIKAILSKLKGE